MLRVLTFPETVAQSVNVIQPFLQAIQPISTPTPVFTSPCVMVLSSKGYFLPTQIDTISYPPSSKPEFAVDEPRAIYGEKYCHHKQVHGTVQFLNSKTPMPASMQNGNVSLAASGFRSPAGVSGQFLPIGITYWNSGVVYGDRICEYRVTYFANGIRIVQKTTLLSHSQLKTCVSVREMRIGPATNSSSPVMYEYSQYAYGVDWDFADILLASDSLQFDFVDNSDLPYVCKNSAYLKTRRDPSSSGTLGGFILPVFNFSGTPSSERTKLLSDVRLDAEASMHGLSAMQLTPSKQFWELFDDAIKSVAKVDMNNIENTLQLSEVRDLGAVFKRLSEGIRKSKVLRKNPLTSGAKALSRAYLLYQYGLRPTVSDAKEISAALTGVSTDEAMRKQMNSTLEDLRSTLTVIDGKLATDSTQFFEKRFASVIDSLPSLRPGFTGDVRYISRVVFVPQCITELQGLWRNLREWGFDPSLSNLWDLVPWSFAIDWFLRIGDLLESFDAFVLDDTLYDIKCVTQSEKRTMSYTYDGIKTSYLLGSYAVGTVTVTSYKREPSDRPPLFHPSIDRGTPSRHIVEGTALFVQAL